MATLALQDMLAVEPSLADRIDSMTELIPGVPASKQNLKTLLEHVTKERDLFLTGTDDTSGVLATRRERGNDQANSNRATGQFSLTEQFVFKF